MSVRTLCKAMAAATLVAGCLSGTALAAGAGAVEEPGRPGVAATYPPPGPEPTPVPTPAPPGGKLPFTGAQVLGMTAVGGGLGIVGVLLVVASRRRHRANAG